MLVDADRVYETAEMIPTGWIAPATGELDLRGYPALAGRRLDVCYQHTRAALRVRWADIELTMRSSPNVTHAVVYTPARAVCVEPQTCAPDAFNLAAQGVERCGYGGRRAAATAHRVDDVAMDDRTADAMTDGSRHRDGAAVR